MSRKSPTYLGDLLRRIIERIGYPLHTRSRNQTIESGVVVCDSGDGIIDLRGMLYINTLVMETAAKVVR